METKKYITIDFTDVVKSHRINPIQNEYIRTLDDALGIASKLVDTLFGKYYEPNLTGDFLKKTTENVLAACIYFFVNYEVRPYDKDWNELVEQRIYDENTGEVKFIYTDKNGDSKGMYCKKGKYADLPHVFAFIMQEDVDIIDTLCCDMKIEQLLVPLKTARTHQDFKQVSLILDPLRTCIARLMTPEIFWILSGNDFKVKSDDNREYTSLILMQEDKAWGGVKALNETIIQLFQEKAEIKINDDKNNDSFFHKWNKKNWVEQDKQFPFYVEAYKDEYINENYLDILKETKSVVNRVLGITDNEIVSDWKDEDKNELYQDIDLEDVFREELLVEQEPEVVCKDVNWIPFGKSQMIGDKCITRGGVYVYSGEWKDIKDLPVAPLVVVEQMATEADDDGYNDFKGYFDMTPQMRDDYLQWLSGKCLLDNLNPTLFKYYLHGVSYRLFMDSYKEEKIKIVEVLRKMWDECVSSLDKLKDEIILIDYQMESLTDEKFKEDFLLNRFVHNIVKPHEKDKLGDTDKIDEYENLGRKKNKLSEAVNDTEQYINMIGLVVRKAEESFFIDLTGSDSCRQLLDCIGSDYNEKDVEEVRELIGRKERLSAAGAYNLSVTFGVIDLIDYTDFHLNVRSLYLEKFNDRYPMGLYIGMKYPPKKIHLPVHACEGFYKPVCQVADMDDEAHNIHFNSEKVYESLKDFAESFYHQVESSFKAFFNVVKKNKGVITPFALLCLPKEVNLDKIGVCSYLQEWADLLFRQKEMHILKFKDFLHFLGYPLYPTEDKLKYYKAKRMVQGLKKMRIRFYMDYISWEDGELFPRRDIPIDTDCIIWRESESEVEEKEEWKDVYKDMADIAKYILDAGNCKEDILLVDSHLNDIQPNRLKMHLKVLFLWNTMYPRKYKRNKWTDVKYRKEVTKYLKEKMKYIKKKIAKANKKAGITVP